MRLAYLADMLEQLAESVNTLISTRVAGWRFELSGARPPEARPLVPEVGQMAAVQA